MTQQGLAEKSGCHFSYISDLERGLSNPSIEILYKLSNALGMPPHEFMKLIEQEDIDELI